MKIHFLPILLAAALLSACGSAASPEGRQPATAQPIVSSDTAQPEEAPQPQEKPQDSAPLSQEDTLENYYRAKAEKEACELETDRLEADFRAGKLEQESFSEQKSALKKQEIAWEREEDRLEYLRPRFDPSELSIDTSDLSALLKTLQTAELAEDQAELQQEQLEMQYSAGSLSREEFIQEYALLLEQEDTAEDQADWLEDQLELLGWDD